MGNNSTNKKIVPLLLVGLGTLMLLGAIIVFVNNENPSPTKDIPTQSSLNIPYPDVMRVSLTDAKAAFDRGIVKFVDTRGEPYFSQGHIPGALSIPEDEVMIHLDQLSQDDWIITYCT